MDEFAALGLAWLGYRGSPLANTMNARGVERGFLLRRAGGSPGTGGSSGIGLGRSTSLGAGRSFGRSTAFGRSTSGSAGQHTEKDDGW